MNDKPWNDHPATLHYVYFKKANGEVSKFIERGDMVDQCIERLGWGGLEIIKIEKKRET